MPSRTASIRKTISIPAATSPPARAGRRPARRSLPGDALVIAALLAATNYALFRSDPCWLGANPTPLLLLPILIGGRYGSAAGLLAGLLSSGAVIGVMHLLGTGPAQLFHDHSLALASLPIAGLICGEIYAFFNAKLAALSARCDQLEEKSGRAAANLEAFADSNAALQHRLALHGVRFTSLDSELRRLLAPSRDDLFGEALALLNRVTEITEAAIYRVDGRDLERQALLGNGDELPVKLRSDQVEIIDQALAEKQMVTCRELWGNTPQLFSRHVAAIPWGDAHGNIVAVLVVRRLPFHRVTWQNFAQIETICTWISLYTQPGSDHGGEPPTPPGEAAYERTLALCIDTHRKHALPSSAVHLVARDEAKLSQKKLHDAVAPLLRTTDLAARLGGDRPNLAVLLPMDGRGAAERLVAQLSPELKLMLEAKLAQTEDADSTDRFMRRLQGGS